MSHSAPPNQGGEQVITKDDSCFRPDDAAASETQLHIEGASSQYTSSPAGTAHAFREIAARCADLRLPAAVRDIAQQLYKTAARDGLVAAPKSVKPFAAVCILLACRAAKLDCALVRIHQATGVKRRVLGACFYVLERRLNPGAAAAAGREAGRWARELGVPPSAEMACQFVVGAVDQYEDIARGCSRRAVGAAALYFACRLLGYDVPVGDVLRVSDTSLRAVRAVYARLVDHRLKLVRQEWLLDGTADFDRLSSEVP